MTLDFTAENSDKCENSLERVVGLGNRRSIRLSYGANGSFLRFPPLSGQTVTRNTRRKVLSMASQKGAQSVPVSPQAGFDPSRSPNQRYALCESGWIEMSDGWRFLFGGSTEMALNFARRGILDSQGFTLLGTRLRDTYGRGKAAMLDTRPIAIIAEGAET